MNASTPSINADDLAKIKEALTPCLEADKAAMLAGDTLSLDSPYAERSMGMIRADLQAAGVANIDEVKVTMADIAKASHASQSIETQLNTLKRQLGTACKGR